MNSESETLAHGPREENDESRSETNENTKPKVEEAEATAEEAQSSGGVKRAAPEPAPSTKALKPAFKRVLASGSISINTPFKSPVLAVGRSTATPTAHPDTPRPAVTKASKSNPVATIYRRASISAFKTPVISSHPSTPSSMSKFANPKVALVNAEADLRTLKLVINNVQQDKRLDALIQKWQEVSRSALEDLRDAIGEGSIGRRLRLDQLSASLQFDISDEKLMGNHYNVEMDSFEGPAAAPKDVDEKKTKRNSPAARDDEEKRTERTISQNSSSSSNAPLPYTTSASVTAGDFAKVDDQAQDPTLKLPEKIATPIYEGVQGSCLNSEEGVEESKICEHDPVDLIAASALPLIADFSPAKSPPSDC